MLRRSPRAAFLVPRGGGWIARLPAIAAAAALLLLAGGSLATGSTGGRATAGSEGVHLRHALPRAQRLTAPAVGSAPVCKGYRIIQPGPTATNGQLIEFYSYWDSAGYDVTADLSALDALASAPVSGTYIGEGPVIEGDSLTVWPCFWFTHTIAADNPQDDASGIAVPILAVNAATADSTTNEALSFCLSNHPPQHLRSRIIGDAARFVVRDGDSLYVVRNGDLLRVDTQWSFTAAPFAIAADFSAVDDSFDVGTVYYSGTSDDGFADYTFWYELDERARTGSEYPLPLLITGFDGGCGRDSISLLLEMDNDGPAEPPVLAVIPEQVSDPELVVGGRATAEMTDVLILLNGSEPHVATVHASADSFIFADTLMLAPGPNTIVAYGRDLVGNRSPASEEYQVDLQDVPEFKRVVVLAPDSTACGVDTSLMVSNDALLRFTTYWDSRAIYQVYADLSGLDTGGPARLWGTRVEDLQVTVGDSLETWYGYQFEHRISAGNLRNDDDDIVVPVTAQDPSTGFGATTEALQVCLSNHPPEHLWTRILGDSARFVVRDADTLFLVRNDGTINIQTSWRSWIRPLSVRANFGRVDGDFLENWVDSWLIDSLSTDSIGTYGISYHFSLDACCSEGTDPYPLPAPIRIGDSGCGCGEVTLRLEMDNEGPAGSPTIDPALPSGVSASPLTVTGTAPGGSFDVLIEVEHVEADSLSEIVVFPATEGPVDTFSASVPLLPGSNRLVVYGRDAVGNRSIPSLTYDIHLVAAGAVIIPKPFRRGDAFLFSNPDGWSALQVAIFNLEGDRVWSRDYGDDPIHYLEVAWDGRNGVGENVRQGPYLLRYETTDLAGGRGEEVRAFVYKR